MDIWSDLDRSKAGEGAAHHLAKRLHQRKIAVRILTPTVPIPINRKGIDWLDVLNQKEVTA
ncbi:MAG: hypothetical protein HQL50_08665 [Magnetococcales bacterium]|nr:hypothetical protein [Magnetococcales bacterium]